MQELFDRVEETLCRDGIPFWLGFIVGFVVCATIAIISV